MKNLMLSTRFIWLIILAGAQNTYLTINAAESQTPGFVSNLRHAGARMAAFLRINESKQLPKQQSPVISAETSLPLIIYLPSDKKIKLVGFPNNASYLTNNLFHRYFAHINNYALSPQKKYLLIDTTSAASIVTRFSSWFGQQISSTHITKLINAHDGSEIASFSGKKVTYQFSPNEETLLIAGPQKSLGEQLGWTGPSSIGAGTSGYRTQAESGEILRYELFDIASKKVLKTFENIQSIDYIAEDRLLAAYDDESQQEITVTRNTPLSPFWQVMNLAANLHLNIAVKEENKALAKETSPTITYYDDTKKLIVKNNGIESTFQKVESYITSPDKKYILIQHQTLSPYTRTGEYIKTFIPTAPWGSTNIPVDSGTTIFNTTTQQIQKLTNNFITYEFSPDGTKLLILISAEPPQYSIIDLKDTEITPVPKSKTAYFTHTNNLAYITDSNEKKEISFTKKELEKSTPIKQAVSSAAIATQKQASEYWTVAQKKAANLATEAKNYFTDLTKPFWSLSEEEIEQKQKELEQQEREQRQREFEAEIWEEENDDEADEDDKTEWFEPDYREEYNA